MMATILFHTVDNYVLSIYFQPGLLERNIYSLAYWIMQICVGMFCAFGLYHMKIIENQTTPTAYIRRYDEEKLLDSLDINDHK